MYERLRVLATVGKICIFAGIVSFGLAFVSSKYNFAAGGFVLFGAGIALLFLRDAFRPRPHADEENAKPTGGGSDSHGGSEAAGQRSRESR
jgi:hypothetical protein